MEVVPKNQFGSLTSSGTKYSFGVFIGNVIGGIGGLWSLRIHPCLARVLAALPVIRAFLGWLIGIGLIVMGGALLFSGRIIESRQD